MLYVSENEKCKSISGIEEQVKVSAVERCLCDSFANCSFIQESDCLKLMCLFGI